MDIRFEHVATDGTKIYRAEHVNPVTDKVRVLGYVQLNVRSSVGAIPASWRAVAVEELPEGPPNLWSVAPARQGFTSRERAAVWLLGMADADSAWVRQARQSGGK